MVQIAADVAQHTAVHGTRVVREACTICPSVIYWFTSRVRRLMVGLEDRFLP